MKQRAAYATFGTVTLSALLFIAMIGREPSIVRAQVPTARSHFIEAGKSYTFGYSIGKRTPGCKVLEEPRENWVKVLYSEDSAKITAWESPRLGGLGNGSIYPS